MIESRKLQKTGGSSLTLTLPKKWTEQHDLREKEEVVMRVLHSGILALRPGSQKKEIPTARLQVNNMSQDELLREVVGYYIAGANKIHMHAENITPVQRDIVRHAVNTLFVGFEITDESGSDITLRNILDTQKFQVKKTIEKMFGVTNSMIGDCARAISSGDKALARDIIGRDTEINKWQLAITRRSHALMRTSLGEEEGGLSQLELSYYEFVAIQLERIADHAVKIMRFVDLPEFSKFPVLPEFEISTKHVRSLLEHTKGVVMAIDKKGAQTIFLERTPQKQNEYLAKITENTKDARVTLIYDSIDRWMGYLSNIAERTIDHSIALEY